MQKNWLFVAGLSVAAVAIVFVWQTRDVPVTPESENTSPEASPVHGPSNGSSPQSAASASPLTASFDDPRAAAENAVAVARSEHADAVDALAEAERHLEKIERDLEDVERYVEDLEQLGEDPARHAEEGMNRLNPVIAQYEERMDLVERPMRERRAPAQVWPKLTLPWKPGLRTPSSTNSPSAHIAPRFTRCFSKTKMRAPLHRDPHSFADFGCFRLSRDRSARRSFIW